MKRMLDQNTINKLKELLSKVSITDEGQIDFGDNVIFIGSSTVIDGVNDELTLENLTKLVDISAEPLFPLENNAGKVLAVNEDEDGLEIYVKIRYTLNEIDGSVGNYEIISKL